jgi:hypothetical protein
MSCFLIGETVLQFGHFFVFIWQYWIEWLKRANVPFQLTRHLLNPYNENKKVQTSRDGQASAKLSR